MSNREPAMRRGKNALSALRRWSGRGERSRTTAGESWPTFIFLSVPQVLVASSPAASLQRVFVVFALRLRSGRGERQSTTLIAPPRGFALLNSSELRGSKVSITLPHAFDDYSTPEVPTSCSRVNSHPVSPRRSLAQRTRTRPAAINHVCCRCGASRANAVGVSSATHAHAPDREPTRSESPERPPLARRPQTAVSPRSWFDRSRFGDRGRAVVASDRPLPRAPQP